MTHATSTTRRPTNDPGMVAGLVVGMFASVLALSALVFDGARLVAARAELEDHAANAGRAAAQEVVDVRLGTERIDPKAGREAALRYLRLHGLVGEVRIAGLQVEVALSRSVPMTLLSYIGISERRVAVERMVRVIDS
ncbi:MAG: hypothetical protein EBU98_06610 [Actinobacteria bacterium]|nr:hypothetical protein [Actinomycetota bacterium]NBO80196.1 hypothetical protein [Actinomycetota bacterium]NBP18307.1 hypothetical protein [Actinomycetota bacterium]NDG77280.1 hypothetical protein [Acidimicrobiia bacterium]